MSLDASRDLLARTQEAAAKVAPPKKRRMTTRFAESPFEFGDRVVITGTVVGISQGNGGYIFKIRTDGTRDDNERTYLYADERHVRKDA